MLSCSLAVVLLSSKRGKIEISFGSLYCFFSSILVAANRNLILKKKEKQQFIPIGPTSHCAKAPLWDLH